MDRIYDMRKPKTNLQVCRRGSRREESGSEVGEGGRSPAAAAAALPPPALPAALQLHLLPFCCHCRRLSQIKQNVLLRYRHLAAFLRYHAPDIYAEVRCAVLCCDRTLAGDRARSCRDAMRKVPDCCSVISVAHGPRRFIPSHPLTRALHAVPHCAPLGARRVCGEGRRQDAGPVPLLLGSNGAAGGERAPGDA